MKKILYITIESKSRELYPKLFLVNSAIRKNFDCFVGDKVAISRAVKILGSGIYFYKSINHYDTKHIENIKKNHLYVSQDEEGGFARPNDKELNKFITYRSSKKNIELIDRFYNWGIFDYSNYVNRYKDNKKKFLITGSPRIDLWKNSISKKIFNEELKEIKKYKNFVLVASSGVSSLKELKKRSIVDKLAKKLRNKKEINKKNFEHLYEYKIFKENIKLIKSLALRFPELNFIVRKHPNENIKDWEKIVNKFPANVYFDNRFDIYGWLYLSKCTIHTASTVGLQAYFMKKNVISFVPGIPGAHRGFSNRFGIKATNINQVLKKIDKILNNKNISGMFSKKKNKILQQRIFFKTNILASDIITEDLNKLSKNFKNRRKVFIFLYSIYFYLRSFFSEIRHFFINKKKTKILLARRSIAEKIPGGIKKNEIKIFYKNLLQNKEKINEIKINQLGPNGFLISKKGSQVI